MKALGIFLAFMLMLILGFFAVGFTDSVTPPTAGTTAGNQYANLTQAMTISNTGLYAVMLILIMAMVFASLLFICSMVFKKGRYT